MQTGLVCAVVVGFPFEPRQQAPAGCSQRNSSVLNPILALFIVGSPGEEIVAGATATFLDIQFRNTKVVLIALFRISRIRCYYFY